MRGGLERWKRGAESHGVRQALAYALKGSCDSHLRSVEGVDAALGYGGAAGGVERFTVETGHVAVDRLDETRLRRWVDGCDPDSGERRGRELTSPHADLLLDGTINAPKSFSVAAMLHPEVAAEFEAMQDRLRDRIIRMWQAELNARRGAGGRIREDLHRIEVVELRHRRSRALDPHIHRHLWLGVKVLGVDGKWSNIDSRVAMKMHTLINAEGDLAARTDPDWIAALARHGYTLDAAGEIAELAHMVRPLSRRSTQIEANRAVLLTRWRDEHPGQEPGPDQLHRIDRLAWATSRPNKPGQVDEATWEQLITAELETIDPAVHDSRAPVAPPLQDLAGLDLDLLAARAIVEADARSACCGGRFSLFDVRAGATRALATEAITAPREQLQPVIDHVVARALELTIDLLADEPDCPAHVKGRMSTSTAALKVDLAAQLETLSRAGDTADLEQVEDAASDVLEDVRLDDRQTVAAAAIAGTDRLVSVTGPAGAGKTTMLRVAKAVLNEAGRRMVVVAPTKKAASVAGREIGTAASSLHALLADHGFRWSRDAAGAEHWTRLAPGVVDAVTGRVYPGPRRYVLEAGDRVVVDEAGMVDLRTAHALTVLVAETGADLAMVGDHLQARPVGHSGAMASLTRRATAVVELTAVHRFRDPDYAALTLRMREPASKDAALAVAGDLADRDLIHRVADEAEARTVMVDGYFAWAGRHRRVSLVTSTNDEADAINTAIQERRLQLGQLRTDRIAVGQGEQRLLEGDVVQTRRNDRDTGVENRALWTIRHITSTGIDLVSLTDSGDTRTVTPDYCAGHVHLAYASTVHGIQGETTDASIVGPGVDAAGLYVGMTRGRTHNEAIAIARSPRGAADQIADSMLRGIPEVTIDDSIRAAHAELDRAARTPTTAAPDSAKTDREWLRAARDRLIDLDARIAAAQASVHGRDETRERIEELTRQHAALYALFLSRTANYEADYASQPNPEPHPRREGAERPVAVVSAGRDPGRGIG